MTDLYDDAAALPRLLRNERPPRRYGDLIPDSSRAAIRWATGKGQLTRPFHAVYQPGSPGGALALLDAARAALLVAPPLALVGHLTAAALFGFGVMRTDVVHLTVPAATPVPQRRGVVAHENVLPVPEVVDLFGLPCVPAARCAVDLARGLSRPDALAVLDAAIRCGAASVDDLATELVLHDRLRGVRQARELLPLATPLAECRQETQVRLVIHDGRLPPPTPQFAVVDEWGVERSRVDLAYEDCRVGIEYDGASHLDRRRMRADRARHNWLSARGWAMRYFTDRDLYEHPGVLVATIRQVLVERRSRILTPIKDEWS